MRRKLGDDEEKESETEALRVALRNVACQPATTVN